jgi:hypothetical protein
MSLKIYDKKNNNKESLAEIYNLLTEEFKTMPVNIERTHSAFKSIGVAVEKLSEQDAIDKIILFWVTYFTFFSRVNFLLNVVKVSEKDRRIKGKEVKEFTEIVNSHIVEEIDSSLHYMQWHISYFYFRFFEVRNEIDLGETITSLYLRAYQSAVDYVDSQSSKSASKFSEIYTLEILLKRKLMNKIDSLQSMADTED